MDTQPLVKCVSPKRFINKCYNIIDRYSDRLYNNLLPSPGSMSAGVRFCIPIFPVDRRSILEKCAEHTAK